PRVPELGEHAVVEVPVHLLVALAEHGLRRRDRLQGSDRVTLVSVLPRAHEVRDADGDDHREEAENDEPFDDREAAGTHEVTPWSAARSGTQQRTWSQMTPAPQRRSGTPRKSAVT